MPSNQASTSNVRLLLKIVTCSAIGAFSLLITVTAAANLISSRDCLPQHKYVKRPPPIQYSFPQAPGVVIVDDVIHGNFTPISPATDPCAEPPGPNIGDSLTEHFESTVRGRVMIPAFSLNSPFFAPADVRVMLTLSGQNGNTRTFDTEMLQLDISGGTLPVGTIIRESPTLASLGQTMITDIGSGLFEISSFFDIFTELSLDGGQTFVPAERSAHVELVPEPGTLALLCAGLALLGFGRGRARKFR